jgi:cell division protein FtsN
MNAPRITSRDFKTPPRATRPDLRPWRGFAAGLVIGLLIATVVYLKEHHTAGAPVPDTDTDAPVAPKAAASKSQQASEAGEPAADYTFYDMLPKFEVVIPERDREVQRNQPAAPIEQAGAYVLQAGSYRNAEDAERKRSQLLKQGIDAAVQRVAVDADVWHRLRIGPLRDLPQLNRLREQLRRANIDALVIRVDN